MSAVELDKNNFEEELETVGENIKHLDSSAEKAMARRILLVCVDILFRCKLSIC